MAKRNEIDWNKYADEELIAMVEQASTIPMQSNGKKGTEAFQTFYGVDFTYNQAFYELGDRGYTHAWVHKEDVGVHRTNAQKLEAAVGHIKDLIYEEEELDRISLFIGTKDHQALAKVLDMLKFRKYAEAALMHTLLQSFTSLMTEEDLKKGEKIIRSNKKKMKKRLKREDT